MKYLYDFKSVKIIKINISLGNNYEEGYKL